MKEITNNFIENVEGQFVDDPLYKVARRALLKNSISSVTQVNEEVENTRNRFSIDIETLPVTNQKKSGRCWIFAGCNVLREKIAKKYNLDNFELSQNYVAFYDKFEKCNYLMESIITLKDNKEEERTLDTLLQNGIEDGGQWDLFVNIVNKYGVVPKDSFPETYQSSNTKEIDAILNRYIRKFAATIKNMPKDSGINDDIEALKTFMMGKIYIVLCSSFGIPPKTINFEYVDKDKKYNCIKNITPQDFLKEYVEVDLNNYVSIINSPTEDKPFNDTFTVKYLGNVLEGNKVKYLNLPIERLKELVISQLKDNEPVWFGSDCSKNSEREEGVWDDNSFDYDTLFQIDTKMDKGAMLDTRESAMNHAMVITGVNLDENIPTKWKIENSWGDDIANKGYYVCSDTWFNKYVYQAVIDKKYLNENELNDLEKEPKKLEIWDPMGTLA